MENKLKSLFEFQKFEKNEHLDRLIQESLSRYEKTELSEDDLFLVNAAGPSNPQKPNDKFDS